MEFHPRLRKFHQKYGRLDMEAFLGIFTLPILVFELRGVAGAPQDFLSYAETQQTDTGTVLDEDPEARYQAVHVAPLVKSDRNDVEGRILLGRASGNDIVIPHPSISKSHALFEKVGDSDECVITDLGSAFGTVVHKKKLIPKKPSMLRTKDPIEFAGSVSAHFFSPTHFYEYMTIMARHMKR
jgi:hypothetical protein